jgi:hypothetical protein
LFELRKKYVSENGPLHAIIRLLVNSIYGKGIMKDHLMKTVIKRKSGMKKRIVQEYNFIREIVESKTSDRTFFEILKTIEKSFAPGPVRCHGPIIV